MRIFSFVFFLSVLFLPICNVSAQSKKAVGRAATHYVGRSAGSAATRAARKGLAQTAKQKAVKQVQKNAARSAAKQSEKLTYHEARKVAANVVREKGVRAISVSLKSSPSSISAVSHSTAFRKEVVAASLKGRARNLSPLNSASKVANGKSAKQTTSNIVRASLSNHKGNYTNVDRQLCEEQKRALVAQGVDARKIGEDGILNRGGIYEDGGYLLYKASPNFELENRIWYEGKAKRNTILFLSKDQNLAGGDAWSVCGTTGRLKYDSFGKNQFDKRNAYLAYGLAQIRSGKRITFRQITDKAAIGNFDSAPLARINVKAEGGMSTVSDAELRKHIKKSVSYTHKRIENLDPDIIICEGRSGSSGVTLEEVVKTQYPDLKMFDKEGFIYYSPSAKKVVINCYHPSYRAISDEEFVDRVLDAFSMFEASGILK